MKIESPRIDANRQLPTDRDNAQPPARPPWLAGLRNIRPLTAQLAPQTSSYYTMLDQHEQERSAALVPMPATKLQRKPTITNKHLAKRQVLPSGAKDLVRFQRRAFAPQAVLAPAAKPGNFLTSLWSSAPAPTLQQTPDIEAMRFEGGVYKRRVQQALVRTETDPKQLEAQQMRAFTEPSPSWKFPHDAQAHQNMKLPDDVRVREMFSDHGYFFVSNFVEKGSFGAVHMAMNLEGQLFAFKKFRTELAADFAVGGRAAKSERKKTAVTFLQDIHREVQAVRDSSEGLELYGSMMWRGKYYLIMNLFKGDAWSILTQLPLQTRQYPIYVAVRDIAIQLHRLHERNRLHRDVKWENVLVNREGKFFLGDFGMWTKVDPSTGTCDSDRFMGTYFSPQILSTKRNRLLRYQAADDVWALGVSVLDAYLPEYKNPFRFYCEGSEVGWGDSLHAVAQFKNWHQSITSFSGKADLSKIRRHEGGEFGRTFNRMKNLNPGLTKFLLTYVLTPDPLDMATAKQMHDYFAEALQQIDDADVYQLVAAVSPGGTHERTEQVLRAVHGQSTKKSLMRQWLGLN